MMLFSSLKAAKHLLTEFSLRFTRSFLWNDYLLPTTLQLQPHIEQLIESLDNIHSVDKIQLGLHEALVNAVKHGNLEDSRKYLRVRRILTPNWLVWQIQDQGEGIPYRSRTSDLPAQFDCINGRGLFLIHQCFDDVRWSRRGNRLQLASRR